MSHPTQYPALWKDTRHLPPEAIESINRLDHEHISAAATTAALALIEEGVAVANITPGDMTVYGLVIIDQAETGTAHSGGRYAMASTYGKLRALPDPLGTGLDLGYVEANYLDPRYANLHTAVVLATFIKAVGQALALYTPIPEQPEDNAREQIIETDGGRTVYLVVDLKNRPALRKGVEFSLDTGTRYTFDHAVAGDHGLEIIAHPIFPRYEGETRTVAVDRVATVHRTREET